jgi:hypothetical protein
MQSEQLNNSQATAELCPDAAVRLFPCEDPRNGYLAVKRDGVFVRLCPWCEEPLPPAKRKPFKFCNNKGVCRKQFERHGGLRKREWGERQNAIWERSRLRTRTSQWVTVMCSVDVGVKKSGFAHGASGGTKSDVIPIPVLVGCGGYRPDNSKEILSAPEGSLATTPRKVTHYVPEQPISTGPIPRWVGKKPRVKTNFCPECGEYMTQSHEHIERGRA